MKKGTLGNSAKNVFSMFPPPRFLTTPAVGVNISDHSIKVLELVPKKKHLVIGRYMTMEIPDGVISSGIVKNDADFISILKKVKKEMDLLFIRASVPEENAYSFNLTLPNLSEKELYNTIKFQLSEHVPLSVEESVFDYDVVSVNGEKVDVSVSVLPKRVVDQYVNFFSAAGLIPISLEIEAQSMARAVIPKGNNDVTMIVDIGRTRTGVSIVSGHVVHYTATLETGGDSFVAAIQKAKDITFREAEQLKQKVGFVREEDSEIYELVVSQLSVLKDELSRRFDYWDTHLSKKNLKEKTIKKIVLVGGNATTPGLKDQLESALSIPVEIGNVWVNTTPFEDEIPAIDFNHSLGFASAVGLALSSEI